MDRVNGDCYSLLTTITYEIDEGYKNGETFIH